MQICKSEQEYINTIADAVRACCKRYGYLPSVLIAQSCLENGYGIPAYWDNVGVQALVEQNNMVGIKTELLNASWSDIGLTTWGGKSIVKRTHEEYNGRLVTITDSFRVYDNPEQSFADYLCFMTYASNNGPGGVPKYGDKVLTIKDPETLIKKVSSLGYATGSTYPSSVMRIVNKHNLTQYDDLTNVNPTAYVPGAKKEESMGKVEKPVIIDRVKENAWQVPYHNENSAEYLAIHYLGVNGENPDLYGGGYGGHFYVSKSGVCYQAAKVSDEIWHVGRGRYEYIHPKARNYNTIGIECATFTASGRDKDEETWYFTEKTQEACAKLAAWILDHYKIPFDHLLRHGDITTKNCPSPYKRDSGKGNNWTWEQFKAKVKSYLEGAGSVREGEYMTSFVNVHKGVNGADALTVQRLLYAQGYKGADGKELKLDGDFAANSEFALKAFQKANGLKDDGDCGPLTWAKLFGKA